LNIFPKSKNRVEEDDLAKCIDELHNAFPKPESTVVKQEAALDSVGAPSKPAGREVTSEDEGTKKLTTKKEHGGKRFSLKKPVKALKPAVDMQGTLPKKKGLSIKFSSFNKKNKLTLPVTPIPEVAVEEPEPVNQRVLETYSLIEPYCRVNIVKDLDRGNKNTWLRNQSSQLKMNSILSG
jgi:hypothetical protein